VGTGLSHEGSFDRLPRDRRPHLSFRGVDDLLAVLQEEDR
jgi:hypothetical protein